MIFSTLGVFICGGLVEKYILPHIIDYYYSDNIVIEFCDKCKTNTNKNFIHCNKCESCHNEYHYRTCELCNVCITVHSYNKHTKHICTDKFYY